MPTRMTMLAGPRRGDWARTAPWGGAVPWGGAASLGRTARWFVVPLVRACPHLRTAEAGGTVPPPCGRHFPGAPRPPLI